ncbi:hypothetical protein B0G69_6916 [Paraburkholderia sp. RAU2J]|nr:hypothetical protein B0G69_6916 [Paraburkholderia sp. RAU2J]
MKNPKQDAWIDLTDDHLRGLSCAVDLTTPALAIDISANAHCESAPLKAPVIIRCDCSATEFLMKWIAADDSGLCPRTPICVFPRLRCIGFPEQLRRRVLTDTVLEEMAPGTLEERLLKGARRAVHRPAGYGCASRLRRGGGAVSGPANFFFPRTRCGTYVRIRAIGNGDRNVGGLLATNEGVTRKQVVMADLQTPAGPGRHVVRGLC